MSKDTLLERLNNKIFVSPVGVEIGLSWMQMVSILDVIETAAPNLFIELGVWNGGMGSLLVTRCKYFPDFHYIGVDNNPSAQNGKFREFAGQLPNAELVTWDLLTSPITVGVMTGVINRHRIPGRPIMLFCDNGNKKLELQLYAPLLSSGDYVISHDFPLEIQEVDLDGLRAIGFTQLTDYMDLCKLPVFVRS